MAGMFLLLFVVVVVDDVVGVCGGLLQLNMCSQYLSSVLWLIT